MIGLVNVALIFQKRYFGLRGDQASATARVRAAT